MARLSAEQFEALLATITTAASAPVLDISRARNDPAANGPIPQCSLGSNKMRKVTLFNEWLEEAENRMDYIDVLVSPTIKKISYSLRRGLVQTSPSLSNWRSLPSLSKQNQQLMMMHQQK